MHVRATLFVGLLAAIVPAAAAASDPDAKLDPPLRARAAQPQGVSRVIIRTVADVPPADAIKAVAGRPGRGLSAVHGQVALIDDSALQSLAARPDVLSVALDRRVQGTLGADVGDDRRRAGQPGARRGRRRRGRGDRRLRGGELARRSRHRPRRPFRRLCDAPAAGARRLRSRHARGGDHCRQRLRFGRRSSRYRTGRITHRPEGARRRRRRIHQQCHCRDRLRRRAPRALQHTSSESLGRRRGLRVVRERPVHAGREARRRRRHRRRDCGGQSRTWPERAGAAGGHHRAGQRAVGSDGGRHGSSAHRGAGPTTPLRHSVRGDRRISTAR